MCDLKVCRICLKSESKFYKLDEYGLGNCYEDVTAWPVSSKDGLPQYFCYECAYLLHKFHIFKEKCIHGQKIFQEMLWSGPITYAGICENNAKRINKQKYPDLEILTVSERVKTYNYIYNFNVPKLEEFVADVDYSDGPFSDCDNLQDPEIDPVTDLVTDSVTEENALVLDNIKTETLPENATDIKDVPEVEETAPLLDINEIKPEEEEIKTLIEELPIKQEKTVKKKRVVKSVKKRRKRRRPKAKSDTEADSDSSEETLSKIKRRKVIPPDTSKKRRKAIPPDTSKTYKFNKPKSGVKNLAFLNSGFWKKASLTEEEAIKEFEAKAQDRKYLSAAYKCTDCYKGFSQKEMLDRHIPKRHGQALGKMVCRFCKTRYKSLYFLNKHMRQHYTKYECLRCDLVCTLENSALFHEEYHNGVVRKCPHCEKEFKHLSTFYTHLRTHRSKHMCAHCGESFVSQLGLHLHKKAKHINDNEQQPAKSMKDNMYCDICKIKFGTKAAYNKHLAHSAMHTDENLVIDDRFVKNLLKEEEEEYDGNNKTEELLKRRSRVEKTLSAVRKSHLPRRTTKKPTTCHQCGKHFETQSACMKHHIAAHPGTSFFSPKERVICEICGASLAPGSVASHLNQHTREKIYTCDTCGRSFTTSTMMRTHLVTHTGEKKFACSLCDKRFTQNGSLSLHYRTFHLKQPYPKRNRRKKPDPHTEGLHGEE